MRYRLKRITDFTGRDPTQPRDAYVLRVAATVGQLNYPTQSVKRRQQRHAGGSAAGQRGCARQSG